MEACSGLVGVQVLDMTTGCRTLHPGFHLLVAADGRCQTTPFHPLARARPTALVGPTPETSSVRLTGHLHSTPCPCHPPAPDTAGRGCVCLQVLAGAPAMRWRAAPRDSLRRRVQLPSPRAGQCTDPQAWGGLACACGASGRPCLCAQASPTWADEDVCVCQDTSGGLFDDMELIYNTSPSMHSLDATLQADVKLQVAPPLPQRHSSRH